MNLPSIRGVITISNRKNSISFVEFISDFNMSYDTKKVI